MKARLRILAVVLLFTIVACHQPTGTPVKSASEKTRAPVEVTASVDKALVSTEDSVLFSVVVDHEKTIEVNIPDIGSRITGFRINDFGSEEKEEDKRQIKRKWFLLRADVAGSYILPEFEISYPEKGNQKKIKTSEIFVEVQAAKHEGSPTAEDIRDIKDLESTPVFYLGWVLGGLALIVLGVGLFWYKKRRRSASSAVIIAPHEWALQRLDALSLPSEADGPKLKRFCFELSEIVRGYVEARYGFRATDMTSEEIIKTLSQISSLPDKEKPTFVHLLKETDLVKFTDFNPAVKTTESLKDRARYFVHQTKPADNTFDSESLV